ncbi:MAG: sulfur carrier protein ThiS [Desulfuromonadaceae bacterium]|nr:sulfur carrier protein ThiS [Desulfuromonas sp.]MDY0185988.1 sulfur carrier protein ThiS [Desulfuromonadaceae bacterium]
MQLKINGKTLEVKDGCNIEALLQQLGLKADRVAVERNRNIVMRSDFDTTVLQNNDQIEIVNFVGGG